MRRAIERLPFGRARALVGLILLVLLAVTGVAVALATIVSRGGGPSVISHGPRDRPWIALTFDADMTSHMLESLRSGTVRSWYDAAIVAELRKTRTPATIFVTGLWAQTYPAVVESLARDPLLELENHSVDHAGFEASCNGLPVVTGESRKRWEITRTASVIAEIAGVEPRYFRFPGGCHEAADVRLVASLGEQPVDWDVLSGDSFQPSAAVVVSNVLKQVRPGSIIVMHLVGTPNAPATAAALRQLIPRLRGYGFTFVTLQQLLRRSQVVAPHFDGLVSEIDAATRARMIGTSWHPGCPVPIRDLRLLGLDHWGVDGLVRRGHLIVHKDYAVSVLGVFRKLFAEHFPIAHMEPVDAYASPTTNAPFADATYRSLAADNSAGFDCRRVAGPGSAWSEHAYGRAIDINPLENPYVARSGRVSPHGGESYAHRSRKAPGMIHAGDATVRAFASIGWGWGGNWKASKDYQHFSATGR
jgi:peptidoglycan/xylan/chitin deacetylase (PgdA/CDA1 family)